MHGHGIKKLGKGIVMLSKSLVRKRKGSVLVEYALLIAGVALTCALSVAVLGHKTQYAFGLMADIIPGASADDNKPIRHVETIPLDASKAGQPIQLDSNRLVSL